MSKHLKDYLYEEKYHPKRLSDVILPNRIRSMLQGIIDSGNIPGFLFSGSPGTGKTTCAKIICEEIGVDYHVIEGSVNNGIDFVRGALFELAQSSSSNGKYSVIIIDECLEENETIRVGTVDLWKSVALKNLPKNEEIPVVSYNLESEIFENDKAIIVSDRNAELWEVELEDGRKVVVTSNHPFIVEGNQEKSIDDGLSVGDGVIVV